MGDRCPMIMVVDTSGSMREHGKGMLARNLAAYVRENGRVGLGPWPPGETATLLWGMATSMLEVAPDQDLPPFPTAGRARVEPLLAALDRLLAGGGALRVLVLSDGHLEGTEVAVFKTWRRRHPGVSVRALAVGPDAMVATLAKIADPDGVFLPEEIGAAMATWGLPRRPERPWSVGDVVDRSEGAHE